MNKYLRFIGLSLAGFTAFLDYTIVNTALPTLQATFSISITELQWVFNIYNLTMAGFMVSFGRLGDIYGRKKIFFYGVLLMLVGSLGAGLSTNFILLLAFRAIQSLGVASTVTLTINLTISHEKGQVAKAVGMYTMITGLALAIGPYLGGLITEYIGWPYIFFINIPLLIISLFLAIPRLTESRANKPASLDIAGCTLLILILALYMLGITTLNSPQKLTSLITILLATILIPLLIYLEKRHKDPTLKISFFKSAQFRLSALNCIAAGCLVTPVIFFMPIYLQQYLNFKPSSAGILMLTLPGSLALLSPYIGKKLNEKNASKLLLLSPLLALGGIGILWLNSFIHVITLTLIGLIFIGAHWSLTNTVAPMRAMQSVDEAESGLAIGTILSLWNIFAALSIGLTAALYEHLAHAGNRENAFSKVFLVLFLISTTIVLLSRIRHNKQANNPTQLASRK